jgi:Lsr2
MVRNVVTTVELTDDLDGGRAEGAVTFAWDGATYEIDLSKRNAAALEKALKPYISAARRVRRPTTRRGAGSSAQRGGRHDLGEVRAWARANGHDVSDRGRISAAVTEAYDAAH